MKTKRKKTNHLTSNPRNNRKIKAIGNLAPNMDHYIRTG